ncbi:heavy metal-binding domain-containing protein [Armatimonas sp.]|uniref:heavy metal-binding domain-containing protein n=1 Tax=Armatimonas sp. TaxID=1872638 RepID=UPI00286D6772|nr:heavy metal-binding domain-containing protein [Armatimonas sp.]
MAIMTGLSGNEMFCLHLKGFAPGELVIGNSVYSMGFVGSVGAGFKTMMGGEIEQVTQIVHEGRQSALTRMTKEAEHHGGIGITGVSSELIWQSGNVEFLSIGSCIHHEGAKSDKLAFSTSADGQELYCQLDCGFMPIKFAFGNVAYSIGIGGGVMGGLRSLARGEVKEFSDVFNATRHRALTRITEEARTVGANAVLGIQTTILPLNGMQEMVMVGTASRHADLDPRHFETPITSDLTNEELWNVWYMGYQPIQLVLGVSVYSLGFVGSFTAAFKSFVRGEIPELSSLIYEARENAIRRIKADAELVGADDVVGIKTYVYNLGNGLIEFMAIGTAVKKVPGTKTLSPALPPQAVIKDKDTFYNAAEKTLGANLNEAKR